MFDLNSPISMVPSPPPLSEVDAPAEGPALGPMLLPSVMINIVNIFNSINLFYKKYYMLGLAWSKDTQDMVHKYTHNKKWIYQGRRFSFILGE